MMLHHVIEAVVGPWMVGAAAIPEVAKLFTAFGQKRKADQLAKTPRPNYEIPASYKEWLNQAKFNALTTGLPGQAQREAKLAEQSAGSLAALERSQQSPSAMLAGIAAVDKNSKQAGADLAVKGAEYRANQQGQYYNALKNMGSEQAKQWEWNKKSPYLNAMASASALQNAWRRNLQGGIEGLSKIGQQAAMFPNSAWNKQVAPPTGSGVPDAVAPIQDTPVNNQYQWGLPDESIMQPMYGNAVNDYYGYEIDPETAKYYRLNQMMHNLYTSQPQG